MIREVVGTSKFFLLVVVFEISCKFLCSAASCYIAIVQSLTQLFCTQVSKINIGIGLKTSPFILFSSPLPFFGILSRVLTFQTNPSVTFTFVDVVSKTARISFRRTAIQAFFCCSIWGLQGYKIIFINRIINLELRYEPLILQ